MEAKIQKFLADLPDEKRKIAMQVRDIFLAADAGITEDIKWRQLTFVYNGNLAFIYTYKNVEYVNLGFMQAVSLSDPGGLFEGTGKSMRHIKLYPGKKINAAQIKKWVKEAVNINAGS